MSTRSADREPGRARPVSPSGGRRLVRRGLFRRGRFAGYGVRPLPDRQDDEVRTVLEAVVSPADYEALDACLSSADRDLLLTFAERMPSQAVRWCHAGVLTETVVALCLAGLAAGARSAQAVSVLPYRAAELVGVPPERPYEAAADRVPAAARGGLASFLGRTDIGRTDIGLSVVGYEESRDADGFRFVRRP